MEQKTIADNLIELNVEDVFEVTHLSKKKIKNNNFMIAYCRYGSANVKVNNDLFSISREKTLFFNEKCLVEFKGGNYSVIVVLFNGLVPNMIYKNIAFKLESNQYRGEDLYPFFQRLIATRNENSDISLKCVGIMYELLSELIKDSNINKMPQYSSQQQYVEMAKEFIELNYKNEITIMDIARAVEVTPNYLANVFKIYENISPKGYLTASRMEKAKALLKTNKYKIREVGLLVGYKNQLHFSSEFKKYVGVSPLIYKRENYSK